MRIAVGTRKGLWIGTNEGGPWNLHGPYFSEAEIASVAWLPTGSLIAGAMSYFWGPALRRTDDNGATWVEEAPIAFAKTDDASLARIWHLQPDPFRPDVVWAGCEPTSVWRSDDGGRTFALNRGLWDHPHHKDWGPGFGGAAVHTLVPRPDGSLVLAMSTGGVYRSFDEGGSWTPANKGITADFLPGEAPEYGQCVHRIAMDASNSDVLYAQNHGGVFRSDDGGVQWTSIADGLPSDFGFTMLAHPTTPGTAWVIPIDGEAGRIPPEGRLRMYRTNDYGATWTPSDDLPDLAWNTVLRDAAGVCANQDGSASIAFGTRDGCVYVSENDGHSFAEIIRHLPDVLSVRVTS